ncbi:strictosidine synthase family protein [Minicystis rosea]|nr:strictosidine synthase family protein [Minicystis rosea]
MKPVLKKIGLGSSVLMLVVFAYLCLWPVPVEPRAWSAPTAPGYTGAFARNTKLSGLRTIEIGKEHGPEHIAIGRDGKLYAAMTSGNLLRMDPDGKNQQVFANTGGRVLGFDFDATGTMIAADAMKGLLAITADARVSVLTDRVSPSDPIRYADAVVVAPDGTIYFTDASTRFAPASWGGTFEASFLDIIEQSQTGRVLAYEPATKQTSIVAHGFSFANGIALSADGHTLFVNETGRYRVWKVDGHARNVDARTGSPSARVLLDNLPGYPDNLMRGRDGRLWVGLFKPRNPAADSLSDRPFLRKVLVRLPQSFVPLGKPYGHVFAIDENGVVVENLQDPSGAYPEATGATETADRIYIHSLHAHSIGWMPRTPPTANAREEIYILRSIREPAEAEAGFCSATKTGFEPFPTDAERVFSFWSIRTESGKVVDAKTARVAELRACFGATDIPAKQNFYAEIELGALRAIGHGECLALDVDRPEAGMYPVRCQLRLTTPAPFVGGLLTTNTLTSKAAFGGDSNPPGYAQASIATIRLWKGNGQ